MSNEQWVRAWSLDDQPVGSAKVYRGDGCQVAVFRVAEDELYAVDNRCPHEGYPLDKGWVSNGVVTCPWHNFKFDLKSGACVMGDEAARTFPLRLDAGAVHVDVAPPDPEIERPRLLASLERGYREHKAGQMARDVVRLLMVGATPTELALEAARLDAAYAEFGTTHATAVAVDGMRIAKRFVAHAAVLPLMQAFDIGAESNQRRAPRVRPEPIDPGSDAEAAGHQLRELCEAERGAAAEALLRGAIQRWPRAMVEPWIYRLCADHFLDFGHALIYTTKLSELLDHVGWDRADALLGTHLFGIVNGTREDLLPEWTWFRRIAEAGPSPAWREPRAAGDASALLSLLCDGERSEALRAVVRALDELPVEQVIDAISAAAAERLLRFDVAIDGDHTVQEGWLDVTHALTFAAATRAAIARWRSPEAWRLVLFAARFVVNARVLDGERPAWSPSTGDVEPSQIAAAVAERHASEALSLTSRYLASHDDVTPLCHALEDLCLNDGRTRPIVVAHAIKTTLAAFDEHAAMTGPHATLPVLAAVRLLASPIQERRVARLSHEAVRFVIDGKVPKTLT
jgi:nitrite reductase/ring-hydroxylating ferredoxin subunit